MEPQLHVTGPDTVPSDFLEKKNRFDIGYVESVMFDVIKIRLKRKCEIRSEKRNPL